MKNFTIFDNLLDGVLVVNPERIVVYANDAFSNIIEKKLRHILQSKIENIFSEDSAFFEPLRILEKNALSTPYTEMPFHRPGSQEKRLQISGQKNNELIIFYVKDVSLEAILHEKYKNEIQKKEQLIQELDRKVFELEFLRSSTPIGLSSAEEEFSLEAVLAKAAEKLNTDLICIFKAQGSKASEFTFQHILSTSSGLPRRESQTIIDDTLKFLNEQNLRQLFETQSHVLREFENSNLLICGTPSKNNAEINLFIYFFSKNLHDLVAKNARLLDSFSQQTSLLMENQILFQQSITDEKTSLYNHRYFKYRFEQELRRSSRYSRTFSLIIFDIDHFKKVNDTHGHLVGDLVLINIAKIIKSSFRTSDITARYGGEEFVAICTETNVEGTMLVAERVRKAVEQAQTKIEDGKFLQVTVSAGVSFFPKDGATAEQLFEEADKALYRAKSSGRNRIELTPQA